VYLSYFTWILLSWDIKVVHFFGWLEWAILKIDVWVWKFTLEASYLWIMVYIINSVKKQAA
jgi:hypothetical protein